MFAAIAIGAGMAIVGSTILLVALTWIGDIRENTRRRDEIRKWFIEHQDSLRK